MSQPPYLALQASLDPVLSAEVDRALASGGAQISDGQRPLATLVRLEALGQVKDGTPAVALYDGKLGKACAQALGRSPPSILWACREEGGKPSEWEARLLLAVLQSRPLIASVGQVLARARVRNLDGMQRAAQLAADLAQDQGASQAVCQSVSDAMYEAVANALLDAPIGPDGAPKYAYRRESQPVIAPEDACEVTVGVGGGRILVSATDRFGRLTCEPFQRAVAGFEERAKMNQSGGGAGLGIRRMLEQSDLVVARVAPGRGTQVLCAMDLGGGRRRSAAPKSLFFWTERG